MSNKELWQQQAEKIGGQHLVGVITDMRDTLDKMEKRHSNNEYDIEQLKKAFPECDFEGHRRYHETVIESLAERRRLRVAIQEKTISGLIWAGVLALGTMIWKELVSIIQVGH